MNCRTNNITQLAQVIQVGTPSGQNSSQNEQLWEFITVENGSGFGSRGRFETRIKIAQPKTENAPTEDLYQKS